MAQTPISGNEFILSRFTYDDFPLASYLTLGTLANEDWNTQAIDDAASAQVFKFDSDQGSTLNASGTNTGSDTKGSDSGGVIVNSAFSGTQVTGRWLYKWSDTTKSSSRNINWAYTGGTASTADDFSYKLMEMSSTSYGGGKGTYQESDSIDFANTAYTFQKSQATTAAIVGDKATKWNSTISKYVFADIENNISLRMSGSFKADILKNELKAEIKNIKYVTDDVSFTTARLPLTMTVDEFDALPEIFPDDESGPQDLPTIGVNIAEIHNQFLSGDNVIVVMSADGIELDAGAGNDKLSGAGGDDTLVAGAGKDLIVGNRGDDLFVLDREDYDFTSAKSVMADTITDFKYTASEKDQLRLEGFDEVAVFKNLAEAKNAQTDATVIYDSASGKFWYNADGDAALIGLLNFATVKGIPAGYWEDSLA